MNRIANCPACTAQRRGIKSRIAYPHNCGIEKGIFPKKQEILIPKKTIEELKARHWAKQREMWDRIYEENWQALYTNRCLGKFE